MIASLRSLLANNSLEAPFSVLDLGTGNGLLLHTLLDADLTPPARMMGIDYSEGSVTLAREVAEARGEGAEEIRWAQCDCVDDEEAVKRLGEWDVLLDKGTVSLVAASVHLKGAWGGGGGALAGGQATGRWHCERCLWRSSGRRKADRLRPKIEKGEQSSCCLTTAKPFRLALRISRSSRLLHKRDRFSHSVSQTPAACTLRSTPGSGARTRLIARHERSPFTCLSLSARADLLLLQLDAIALSSHASVRSYIRSTRTLRGASGILLLTSCNFTLEELKALFLDDAEGKKDEIEELEEDKKPKFSFGGKTGNTTTAVLVRRRKE
jgi:hypothetical protein